jgi:uncharacterized protein HemX
LKKIDWYAIRQKVLTAVLVFIAMGFLGLVYTTYTRAEETPKRVDTLETRMDTAETQISHAETQISHLDSLVTDINQKMKADSITQGAIIQGIDKLLQIAEAKDEDDGG